MKSLQYTFLAILIILIISVQPALAGNVPVPGPVAPSEGPHTPVDLEHRAPAGRVVFILADRTSINDWVKLNAPNLHRLSEEYAIGLMNCQTGGGKIPENTHLTIGAGVPLRATGVVDSAFPAEEKLQAGEVKEIYKQRTGYYPPPESIVLTEIPKIYYLNEESPYSLGPGTLGKILHGKNIKTAVLGNSDGFSGLHREAVLIAMDDKGIVNAGAIGGSTLTRDPNFPGGIRTNYDNLVSEFLSLPQDVRLVVIDLGDFSRIEDFRYDIFASLIPGLREQSMQRLDNFLGKIQQHIDLDRDMLAVISPTPGGITVNGENALTPFLLAGNGVQHGLVYSPATKRPGIIRNTDLLPTVLKFLGIDAPEGTTGRSLKIMPGEYSLTSLSSLHADLVLTNKLRRPILQSYVFIQLLLLGLSIIFIFWKKSLATTILKPLMLGVMSFPFAALILPLLPHSSPELVIMELLGLVAVLTFISIQSGRLGNLVPFLFISGLTSILIIFDLLMGAPLQKTSLLGYDPIMGARFYGLGNEYMGILISSTIIAMTSMLTQFTKYKRLLLPALCLYFIFTIYVIAAPHLGTNVGGTISSVGAFLVTVLLLLGVNINWRVISFIGTGIILVVLGFILYDINQPVARQSHIGRTATLILAGGFSEIINIISRKLSMNIKLIRYTIWSRIFLASLGCLTLLFYRPSGIMKLLNKKFPMLYKGFAGVIVGSVLALIFNDSGVVAAATAMIFAVYPMIYLIFQEISLRE